MEHQMLYGQIVRRTDGAESYPDRWDRAVAQRLQVGVYVPAEGAAELAQLITRGAGIVGSPAHEDPDILVVHYEGNIHDVEELKHWGDRVHHAAGRHVVAYPTSATAWVPRVGLRQVGSYHVASGVTTVEDLRGVQGWVGHTPPMPHARVRLG